MTSTWHIHELTLIWAQMHTHAHAANERDYKTNKKLFDIWKVKEKCICLLSSIYISSLLNSPVETSEMKSRNHLPANVLQCYNTRLLLLHSSISGEKVFVLLSLFESVFVEYRILPDLALQCFNDVTPWSSDVRGFNWERSPQLQLRSVYSLCS